MVKNKKQIEREVEKYMKLPYTIKLIPEEDGTYFVEIEELPGCMSEGDTPEEALAMIKEAMEGWIESNLERGLPIPPPNIMKKYSGKFLVRVPTSLHRKLAEAAKKEGVSLNQYVVSLLSEKLTVKEIYKKIESLENFERQIDQLVYKLYNLTSEEIKIAKESKK